MDLKLLLEVTLKLIPLTVLAHKCMDLNPDPHLNLEAKQLPVALKTMEVALKLKLIRLTDPVLNQLDPNLDLDLDLDLDLLVAPKPKPKALKLTLLMALVRNQPDLNRDQDLDLPVALKLTLLMALVHNH